MLELTRPCRPAPRRRARGCIQQNTSEYRLLTLTHTPTHIRTPPHYASHPTMAHMTPRPIPNSLLRHFQLTSPATPAMPFPLPLALCVASSAPSNPDRITASSELHLTPELLHRSFSGQPIVIYLSRSDHQSVHHARVGSQPNVATVYTLHPWPRKNLPGIVATAHCAHITNQGYSCLASRAAPVGISRMQSDLILRVPEGPRSAQPNFPLPFSSCPKSLQAHIPSSR
ncbi:hypothetical protein BKA66DRAFT_477211 [Pyrenochaeta sp. MPI-SDFR-AT-0127]|nr:hypothetical protein BKA66DRAFT_477211 [Pyrenochaeta sp. MPI-SDFR-AT-0127]